MAGLLDQLWLGLGPLLVVAVAFGLPVLLILRAAWLGRRRRASLVAPAVEAVARASLGRRREAHRPADIASEGAAATSESQERSVRRSTEVSMMSWAWTWGRIVAGVALLSVAVTAAVILGLRWGTPSYVAVKADRGVLIVNRFTGQAWVVQGRTKYPVETEREERE